MPKVVEVCTTIIKELWLETVEIHFPKTNDEFKEKLSDHMTNKRRDRAELRDIVHLKNYADTGRDHGIKIQNAITEIFWDEKSSIS